MQISPANVGKQDLPSTARVSRVGEEELRSKTKEGSGEGQRSLTKAEASPIDESKVIKAIEHANKSLEGVYTHFEFSIHEKTREIMVKVIDRDSGEVIREIPPEQILDMVAKMWELAGILIDERV